MLPSVLHKAKWSYLRDVRCPYDSQSSAAVFISSRWAPWAMSLEDSPMPCGRYRDWETLVSFFHPTLFICFNDSFTVCPISSQGCGWKIHILSVDISHHSFLDMFSVGGKDRGSPRAVQATSSNRKRWHSIK